MGQNKLEYSMQSYQKLLSLGLTPFSGNRDPLDIKAKILQIIIESRDHMNHFYICKKAALANTQLIRYLTELYCLGFIDKQNHSVRGSRRYTKKWQYTVTEKGKTFLDAYQRMVRLIVT